MTLPLSQVRIRQDTLHQRALGTARPAALRASRVHDVLYAVTRAWGRGVVLTPGEKIIEATLNRLWGE